MRQRFNIWSAVNIIFVLLIVLGLNNALRAVHSQNQGGIPVTSLSAATTGTGTAFAMNNAVQVGWAVIWSSGVTAGEVKIEAAASANYSGTWYELDKQTFSAAPAANSVMLGTFPGPLLFVRARVSTTVSDGTVTVQLYKLTN